MINDDHLQSKYDRLCIEFKKLRNKYKECKHTIDTELGQGQTLKAESLAKDIRIREVEKECDGLRKQNDDLAQQLHLLTHSSSNRQEFQSTHGTSESCLNSISNCHEESGVKTISEDQEASQPDISITNKVSEADHQATDVETHVQSPTASPLETRPSLPAHQPPRLDAILQDLITSLAIWTQAIETGQPVGGVSETNAALVDQVAKLESQVCELSLRCQLERKRRLLHKERIADGTEGDDALAPNTCTSIESILEDTATMKCFQKRIHTLIDQAQYFAGLATFLQDELRSVSPHLSSLAEEACRLRTELDHERSLLSQMRVELNTAQETTLHRSTDMAEHITYLTDELQMLRGLHQSNSSFEANATGSSGKKSSIFQVLKR